MIQPNFGMFTTEPSRTSRGRVFVHALTEVIECHLRTSAKLFRPQTLRDDFRQECGVNVSLQAINSAIQSLAKRGLVIKRGWGLYCHRAHD